MGIGDMAVIDWEASAARMGLKQPFADVGLTLDAVQLVARHDLIKAKRGILSMDKGVGKTITALSISEDPEVHHNTPGYTVLILTTTRGMGSYIRDIKKFGPNAGQIQRIYGNRAQREQRWKNSTAKYFICAWDTLLADAGLRKGEKAVKDSILPKWLPSQVDMVIGDEFHRKLRRRKSGTYEMMKSLFKDTQYLFLLSGSAVDKGPEDLWAALNICDRKMWSTYWGYCETWCQMEDSYFHAGKTVHGPRLKPDGSVDEERAAKWRNAVRPYVFHATAEMCGTLPPLRRDFLDIELPVWQMDLHTSLMNRMFAETEDGELIFAQNVLAKLHKVRTALICPKALDPSFEVGGGIEAIADDAQESGAKQYAVFTPFKPPIPYLREYLQGRGCNVWIMQGGITLDEQEERLRSWRESLPRATPDAPSIILGTTKYAESWEIPEARYGYALGAEYVREDNRQAEGRLHRRISEGVTFFQYARPLGTYEVDLLEAVIQKGQNVAGMFRNWGELKAYMQHAYT